MRRCDATALCLRRVRGSRERGLLKKESSSEEPECNCCSAQVAGLAPVTVVPGVENVDVTGLVKSHANYPEKIPQIMSFISFDM